jgi:hypothetical protein
LFFFCYPPPPPPPPPPFKSCVSRANQSNTAAAAMSAAVVHTPRYCGQLCATGVTASPHPRQLQRMCAAGPYCCYFCRFWLPRLQQQLCCCFCLFAAFAATAAIAWATRCVRTRPACCRRYAVHTRLILVVAGVRARCSGLRTRLTRPWVSAARGSRRSLSAAHPRRTARTSLCTVRHGVAPGVGACVCVCVCVCVSV